MLLLLLLLLSRFSHVRLCATPQTAAHQAPPSLGFSRQEHWSELPFLSPMHESKKWKWNRCHVWLLATPWTAAYQAPPSVGFSKQEYWSGLPLPSLEGDHIHPSLLKTVLDFSPSPSITVNSIPFHSQTTSIWRTNLVLTCVIHTVHQYTILIG